MPTQSPMPPALVPQRGRPISLPFSTPLQLHLVEYAISYIFIPAPATPLPAGATGVRVAVSADYSDVEAWITPFAYRCWGACRLRGAPGAAGGHACGVGRGGGGGRRVRLSARCRPILTCAQAGALTWPPSCPHPHPPPPPAPADGDYTNIDWYESNCTWDGDVFSGMDSEGNGGIDMSEYWR